MNFRDVIDQERAHKVIDHYTGLAGVPNADKATVLRVAESHFKGLLAEWRRHGFSEQTIRATLEREPIAEMVLDRAVEDLEVGR